MMQTEVEIVATNLANIPNPLTPVYNNEWLTCKNNLVPTANARDGVKTQNSCRKPIETCEEFVMSY
jgi:hypothetical protein